MATGRNIGSIAGAILGSIIPGVGTALGGMGGAALGGLFDDDEPKQENPNEVVSRKVRQAWGSRALNLPDAPDLSGTAPDASVMPSIVPQDMASPGADLVDLKQRALKRYYEGSGGVLQ